MQPSRTLTAAVLGLVLIYALAVMSLAAWLVAGAAGVEGWDRQVLLDLFEHLAHYGTVAAWLAGIGAGAIGVRHVGAAEPSSFRSATPTAEASPVEAVGAEAEGEA